MKEIEKDISVIGIIILFTLIGFALGCKLCSFKIDNLCQLLNPNNTKAYIECKNTPVKINH